MTSVAIRDQNGTGRSEIVTIKYKRFIKESGDDLPDLEGIPENAKLVSAGPPALSDSGVIATRATFASGKKKTNAILVEDPQAGTLLPAIQGEPAPGPSGAKFASLFDPVVDQGGNIAFAGTMSGVPGSQKNGVWSNMSGTLSLVLQQGTTPSGLTTEKLVSVSSMAMRTNALLVLAKVSGTPAMKTVLFRINSANVVTPILRTGTAVTVDGVESTIKSITVLAPSPTSPGDGRWQGGSVVVARTVLADKRTVLYRILSNGDLDPLVFSEGDGSALVSGAAYRSFGLPAVSPGGTRYAALATLAPEGDVVTKSNDTGIIFSSAAPTFSAVAKEDEAPIDSTLNDLKYAAFSDPLVNGLNEVAFIGTLKGKGVKSSNNRALFFGTSATLSKVVRLGERATDSSGETPESGPVWKSFTGFALPGNLGPVFVATLAGPGTTSKNNVGVWAVADDGSVRLLIRKGDLLGDRVVRSMTLLSAAPRVFSAGRSFNSGGAVAVSVGFTDNTFGIIQLGAP